MSRRDTQDPGFQTTFQRAPLMNDSHSYSSASSPFALSDRRPPPHLNDYPTSRYSTQTAELTGMAMMYAQSQYSPTGMYLDAAGQQPHTTSLQDVKTETNRRTSSISLNAARVAPAHSSSFNHHHPPGYPVHGATAASHDLVNTNSVYTPFLPPQDHDLHLQSQYSSVGPVAQQSNSPLQSLSSHITQGTVVPTQHSSATPNTSPSRSTLWWGELEPWMDEEYAKQVCSLMGWDSVTVKIPHGGPDPVTGQQANNPGYCFLTFPTPQQAAQVLAQVNNPPGGTGGPVIMPNSNKPFTLNWASSPTPSPSPTPFPTTATATAGAIGINQPQKEFSIFVGDLAPETSNSDLVAVFRNPVLGLRNDRAPKFIRPFYSCKSAKIMLDPATGVSRGYGFVRFTDEADQQRALIEMHGLYCLSRPMRISPATAKFKSPPGADQGEAAATASLGGTFGGQSSHQANAENGNHAGVSTFNIAPTVAMSGSGSSLGSSSSIPSLSSSSTASSMSSNFQQPESPAPLPSLDVLAQLFAQANIQVDSKNNLNGRSLASITAPLVQSDQKFSVGSEDSWKHQAQARAILGNLMGPNGEQLTSTDPYNTTVFVGGLSPLISEETLRTFFAPFGDIHYVKVPVGKHCGFVQFVRKADAERAIERMQGFPIGGSRIRLSWGRSQYKAAQAAAQAAAAQVQGVPGSTSVQLSQDQAIELLQHFGFSGFTPSGASVVNGDKDHNVPYHTMDNGRVYNPGGTTRFQGAPMDAYSIAASFHRAQTANAMEGSSTRGNPVSSFSPFSPDPSFSAGHNPDRDSTTSITVGEGIHRTSSGLVPRYTNGGGATIQPSRSVGDLSTSSDERLSPTNGTSHMSQGSKESFGAERFGFPLNRSAPPFHLNRALGRSSNTSQSSRPSSTKASPPDPDTEQDPIHDVNGTLASLDLDNTTSPKSLAGMSDSSSSVQFTMTANSNRGSPSV
ncbi:RNA-binding domain-containing protein [Rickenella mellea]|uniref:RNA-binding domain-containing protein n=1 Tax=Rickenella mellea TaxID=50990 RepID=A0A4R5XI25_9AGAM|nr:RNA-binding domain-containing protein [Rickenella mellea]